MADPLLLRLHRDAQEPTWLLAGGGVADPESGPLTLAAARAAGRPVIVLVPGADVLRTEAHLPATRGSGAKIQQLVPYALEEQLADDIDALHFALGARAGGTVSVAVVARKRMDEWLTLLQGAGIEPAALFADSELLPHNPTQTVALLEDDSVTVRTPSGGVLLLTADALGEALELAIAQSAGGTAPQGLVLYTTPAEWERHRSEVEAVRERLEGIQVQLLRGDPLQLLAGQLSGTSAINLLQGPYAPVRAMAEGWRTWRLAAILLASLVVLHVAGKAAELLTLRHQNKALDASIGQVFHAAMPGEQSTLEARRRMEQRLRQVRAGEASGGFLDAIEALARARAGAPGITLEAVSFHAGVLDLKVAAPSVETLDQFAKALVPQGWQASLVSGSPAKSGFEGDIRMSRGS